MHSGPRSPQRSRSDRQHDFARVPSVNNPRSVFNRSCGIKTNFDSGFLVPVFVDEALPGDTFNLQMSLFCRTATSLHPVIENIQLESFFFAVPMRLLWDNWAKFNGEQDDPGDSTDFTIPKMVAPAAVGYGELSLSDYMGIPTKIADLEHSAMWHRAYNLIYNEWFRPQDLIDSVVVDTGDADSLPADYVLLRRAKRHDYFTSCLPAPQKGPTMPLPLGDSAPIDMTGASGAVSVIGAGDLEPRYDLTNDVLTTSNVKYTHQNASTADQSSAAAPTPGQPFDVRWNDPKLGVDLPTLDTHMETGTVDLALATGSTINELRSSFQIQRMLEKDARGGTRYTEILRAHFGVVSPDQRLQRPEYLGGGSMPVIYNPVAATASAGFVFPGQLTAFGVGAGTHGFTKSFTEHCVIIGMVNVRADLNYQQGLARMFSRKTRFDFYWPTLAHLGEQAVLQKEIWADGIPGPANDDKVFGYQERYAEYRYKPSLITGQMRSNATTPLDTWHLAQDFATAPVLGETFIEENPPMARIIAVVEEPEFLLDGYAAFRCARPMPTYSVPGHIDHF